MGAEDKAGSPGSRIRRSFWMWRIWCSITVFVGTVKRMFAGTMGRTILARRTVGLCRRWKSGRDNTDRTLYLL